eukprot:gene10198-11246_t
MEWVQIKSFYLLSIIACALFFANAASNNERQYLVVSPRVYRAGTNEVVAVTIFNLKSQRAVFLFEVKKRGATILSKSATFQPSDSGKTKEVVIKIPKNAKPGYAELQVTASGGINFKQSKGITIEKKDHELFIQTDKPVYKPGEKVQFRVVAVSPNLKPAIGKVSEIAVENPSGSRIVQWKDEVLDEGFISLDLTLSKKPVLGTWKITAKYQGVSTSQQIKVDRYVLPKFEVKFEGPSFVHYKNTKFSSRICARYTYGKKVVGKLTATYCYAYKRIYSYVASALWITLCDKGTVHELRTNNTPLHDIETNGWIDGCTDVDVAFNMGKTKIYSWNHLIKMHASVTESATGVTLNGTRNATLVYRELKMNFVETTQFKPGFKFTTKLLIKDHDGMPALNKKVKIKVECCDGRELMKIERVVENGVVNFEVDPPSDAKSINLHAVHHMHADYLTKYQRKIQSWKTVKSWFSPSKTYLVIEKPKQTLQVGTASMVRVQFNPNNIRDNKLFYTLICRGNIEHSGYISGHWSNHISEHKIPLFVTQNMVPKCRLLVNFVRTDGEFVGDSAEINVEKKFENEVTVSFSEDQVKPGRNISINLKAAPGSRFALSAVDKSVQLLGSTSDLKPDKVMNIIERLDVGSGWVQSSRCNSYRWRPWFQRRISRSIWWGSRSDYVDGVKAINDAGLIFFSNLDIDVKPCKRYSHRYTARRRRPWSGSSRRRFSARRRVSFLGRTGGPVTIDSLPRPSPRRDPIKRVKAKSKAKQNVKSPTKVVVRADFPETWIWMDSVVE